MSPEKLGPYKLQKLLGRGGMGSVYVGLNEATGERAAVKLLTGHLADDESFRERFKQEIETLKRLLHPHIVQLHGFGEEDGHLYYVMELVEGRSLQDELMTGRRFNWREVARIGIATAQALKHAHDRGIIHRDLKPANLLIDAQDHIKLADFGIAKLYGGTSVTAEGGMLGTADYMAPEQASGKPVTNRSDLYSLGSVLYALLTGKPPFAARTMVEVIAALQNEPPVPVSRLAPDTPEAFDKLILQLLEKDPQKRIPTALALANHLTAMEHALSLDTRVMDSFDAGVESEPLPPSLLRPPPAKTEPLNLGSSLTAPFPPGNDGEYELAVQNAVALTDAGGIGPASGRTALRTQAGTNTGIEPKDGTSPATETGATSKISQFTVVRHADLHGPRESDDTPLKQWTLVGALAIVGMIAISAAIFFATRSPSADQLYAVIKTAADRGDASELSSVESELSRFLQLYANDSRADEVQEYVTDLEQYRLERRLKPRVLRGAAPSAITPVERAYQDALHLAGSDPEAALDHFEALIDVYGMDAEPNPDSAAQRAILQCIELARQQISRLRPEAEKLASDQRAAVQRQLDRAEQLVMSDRAAAAKIWNGIVTLYRDKRWAKDLVEAAQINLDHLSQDSTWSGTGVSPASNEADDARPR